MKTCLVFALSILVCGCGSKATTDTEFLLGTFVEVTSSDPKAKTIVFQEVRRLEKLLNFYDENSELSQLNATSDLRVSPELFELLEFSKKMHELTQGAFDPTVAPVAVLWKRAIKKEEMPKEDELQAARGLVGFDYVFLEEATRRVRLLKSGSKLDLGAVAKGYAVQRAIEKLREANVASALVNAGGNVYGLGRNGNKPWTVGIRDPRQSGRIVERVPLENKGVATSGDYEQFFVFQNKRYSHIIDPKTGAPVDSGIASATVIASDAKTADALATALVVLGEERGRQVLKNFPNAKARLIDIHGKLREL
ncbi:MAG: FAD:protein FMN transferase [Candidatus Omnitrophota bacterium]